MVVIRTRGLPMKSTTHTEASQISQIDAKSFIDESISKIDELVAKGYFSAEENRKIQMVRTQLSEMQININKTESKPNALGTATDTKSFIDESLKAIDELIADSNASVEENRKTQMVRTLLRQIQIHLNKSESIPSALGTALDFLENDLGDLINGKVIQHKAFYQNLLAGLKTHWPEGQRAEFDDVAKKAAPKIAFFNLDHFAQKSKPNSQENLQTSTPPEKKSSGPGTP